MHFKYILYILAFNCFAADDIGFTTFRDNCSACHLDSGHGNPSLKVPSIAGLPRWYVSDQLRKFRYGKRGDHKNDLTGKLMKASTINLNDRTIAFLGRYVQNLKPLEKRSSAKENSAEGKKHYEKNCKSCHGAKGEGDKSARVPPLDVQPDWYLNAQMEKFEKGQRKHTENPVKIQAEYIKEITSYLGSLKRKEKQGQ